MPEEDLLIMEAFTHANVCYMWNQALDKTKLNHQDNATKIHELHIHTLRKFFRTQMALAIPVDIVEALMGHSGYLTDVYQRYSIDQLRDFYKQGEHTVRIFTEVSEVEALKKEVKEQRDQLQQLVNGLTTRNMVLQDKVENLEDRLKTVEGLVHEAHEIMRLAGLLDWDWEKFKRFSEMSEEERQQAIQRLIKRSS